MYLSLLHSACTRPDIIELHHPFIDNLVKTKSPSDATDICDNLSFELKLFNTGVLDIPKVEAIQAEFLNLAGSEFQTQTIKGYLHQALSIAVYYEAIDNLDYQTPMHEVAICFESIFDYLAKARKTNEPHFDGKRGYVKPYCTELIDVMLTNAISFYQKTSKAIMSRFLEYADPAEPQKLDRKERHKCQQQRNVLRHNIVQLVFHMFDIAFSMSDERNTERLANFKYPVITDTFDEAVREIKESPAVKNNKVSKSSLQNAISHAFGYENGYQQLKTNKLLFNPESRNDINSAMNMMTNRLYQSAFDFTTSPRSPFISPLLKSGCVTGNYGSCVKTITECNQSVIKTFEHIFDDYSDLSHDNQLHISEQVKFFFRLADAKPFFSDKTIPVLLLENVQKTLLEDPDFLERNIHMQSSLTTITPSQEFTSKSTQTMTTLLCKKLTDFPIKSKIDWIVAVKETLILWLADKALSDDKDFNPLCIVANAYINVTGMNQGVDYAIYVHDLLNEITDSQEELKQMVITPNLGTFKQ